MSLAFAIALVVFITEFILWFGYSQIASLAYGVYMSVFEKERIQKQRKIKKDILNVKHELARTSSQDQFAKWAKLRRKLDSKMSELEKITTSLAYMKTTFEIKFTTFLWVFANGIQILMVAWYLSSPAFYLPPGWFGPLSRIFAYPFSPPGSVSVFCWFWVCRRFIKKVIQIKKDAVPLYHHYAPESVKERGSLLIQWCNTQIRIFAPIAVQWIDTNVKTFCSIIIEKTKSPENTSTSTDGTSVASTSKASKTEFKEKNDDASKTVLKENDDANKTVLKEKNDIESKTVLKEKTDVASKPELKDDASKTELKEKKENILEKD